LTMKVKEVKDLLAERQQAVSFKQPLVCGSIELIQKANGLMDGQSGFNNVKCQDQVIQFIGEKASDHFFVKKTTRENKASSPLETLSFKVKGSLKVPVAINGSEVASSEIEGGVFHVHGSKR